MGESDNTSGTSVLDELDTLRDPHDWLLRRAVGIILVLFGITLLLDLLAAVFIGPPPEGFRYILGGLFDTFYQSLVLMLVIMVLLMRAFYRQLRETIRRLIEQELVVQKAEDNTPDFVQAWHRSQDPRHRARILIGAVFMAMGATVFYLVIYEQDLSGLLPGHRLPAPLEDYSTVIYTTRLLKSAGILAALYAIGNWMFVLYQTGTLFRHLPDFFDLGMQPAHPDGSGGFKAAGDLFIKMVYVVLVPTLFLAIWVFVNNSLAEILNLQGTLPPYLLDSGFRIPGKILLGLPVISGLGIFIWPAYTLHNIMMDERAELNTDLAALAQRMRRLNRKVLEDPSSMSIDDREETLADIDSLQKLYDRSRKAPTWPFDRGIAAKLLATQVIPILTLLRLDGPFATLLGTLAKVFQPN